MAQKTRDLDYSDFDIDFLAHPVTGDLVKKRGVAAINQSIENLILTHFWEYGFESYIGSNAGAMLFEPMTDFTARNLENEIWTVLNNFEPRAILQNVTASILNGQDGYNVDIIYRIANTNVPTKITLFLERLR